MSDPKQPKLPINIPYIKYYNLFALSSKGVAKFISCACQLSQEPICTGTLLELNEACARVFYRNGKYETWRLSCFKQAYRVSLDLYTQRAIQNLTTAELELSTLQAANTQRDELVKQHKQARQLAKQTAQANRIEALQLLKQTKLEEKLKRKEANIEKISLFKQAQRIVRSVPINAENGDLEKIISPETAYARKQLVNKFNAYKQRLVTYLALSKDLPAKRVYIKLVEISNQVRQLSGSVPDAWQEILSKYAYVLNS